MAELLMGIDIGTTSCKVGIYNSKGKMVGLSSRSYPLYYPRPHEAEQDAHDWWRALRKAIQDLKERSSIKIVSSVIAIGLSGQTPTQVLVDKEGKVLRPAIIWKDTRSGKEAAWLQKRIGRTKMRDFLGIDLPLQPNWLPARLLWLRRHQPEILKRTFKILQPKDFVGYKLTGCFFSDAWSSKGMVHLLTNEPCSEFLRAVKISDGIVPRIYRPYDIVGKVKKSAAKELGIPSGIPVVAGWGDALCGMLAAGAFLCEGSAFNIAGTSEIAGITTSHIPKSTLSLILIPREVTGSFSVVYGATQSGGDSIRWAAQMLSGRKDGIGMDDLVAKEIRCFLKEAESIEPGSNGLIFLPYLDGERAPVWDPNAKGAFLGIKRIHQGAHFFRSVMEGVAFNVRDVLEVAEKLVDKRIEKIRLSGGGAKICLWNRIRADVIGRRIEKLEVLETGTLGAAMLASVGLGVNRDLQSASKQMVRVESLVEPEKEHSKRYDKMFRIYKRIYPLLGPMFSDL